MSAFFENPTSPEEIYARIKDYSSWFDIKLDNLEQNLLEIWKHVGVPVMAAVKKQRLQTWISARWSYQRWSVILHANTKTIVVALKGG